MPAIGRGSSAILEGQLIPGLCQVLSKKKLKFIINIYIILDNKNIILIKFKQINKYSFNNIITATVKMIQDLSKLPATAKSIWCSASISMLWMVGTPSSFTIGRSSGVLLSTMAKRPNEVPRSMTWNAMPDVLNLIG